MNNLVKVSFVITGDAYMKTDVVSQPINDNLPGGIHYLGEITVNDEQVKRQAKEYDVTHKEELARVVTHGVLHLLGYTDQTAKSRKQMEAVQEMIVKRIDL